MPATQKTFLGYESQTKAIEALNAKGFSPSDIAKICDCDKEEVLSAIGEMRRRTSAPVIRRPRQEVIYGIRGMDTDEDRQRRDIIQRAARGAREQLQAIRAENEGR